MITASIDVTKVSKERFFKGEKGTYMDIVLIPTPDNKYGHDYLIKQNSKKGEDSRSMPIIGNAKDRSKLSKEEESNIPF